uniref:Uncharacterized protein n=1 Tax=Balaenoptera musculus TaxID=9771 RepID=A0A8C0D6D5_BALMU
ICGEEIHLCTPLLPLSSNGQTALQSVADSHWGLGFHGVLSVVLIEIFLFSSTMEITPLKLP